MEIKLVVKYTVPSLNKLFQLGPKGRFQERKRAHHALLSALQHSADGYSTRTIYAQNHLSMAYAMLASYLTTARKTSNSWLRRKGAPGRRSARK